MCRADQLKFKRSLQKQVKELKTSIKAEQSLSEQVIDLREIKAALKERTQASETGLAEARQVVVGLQGREQLLVQEISELKAEVSILRARPVEDPEAHTRFRQIEADNAEMQAEIARLLSDSSEHAEKSKQNSEVITGLLEHVKVLEFQIKEAKSMNVLLEKQKSGCEAHAKAKYENLRSQLLETTNAERAILTKEHSDTMQQMQQKKAATDNRAKILEQELAELKVTQAREVGCRASIISGNMNLYPAGWGVNSDPVTTGSSSGTSARRWWTCSAPEKVPFSGREASSKGREASSDGGGNTLETFRESASQRSGSEQRQATRRGRGSSSKVHLRVEISGGREVTQDQQRTWDLPWLR